MIELDEFTRAYIECALWSETDNDGNPLDDGRDASDLAPEALRAMAEDCADFQKANAETLAEFYAMLPRNEYPPAARAGHDFWLTRNGHGAGFWDRGAGEVGDKLTEACEPYGSAYLYIGDDGKVYQG